MRRNERGKRLQQIVDSGGGELARLLRKDSVRMAPDRAAAMRSLLQQAAAGAVRKKVRFSFSGMRPLVYAVSAACILFVAALLVFRNPARGGGALELLAGDPSVSGIRGRRAKLPYLFSTTSDRVWIFRLKNDIRFRFRGPGRFSVSGRGQLKVHGGTVMVTARKNAVIRLPGGVILGRLKKIWLRVQNGNVRTMLASGSATFRTSAGGFRKLPLRRVVARSAIGGWVRGDLRPAAAELKEMRQFFGEVKVAPEKKKVGKKRASPTSAPRVRKAQQGNRTLPERIYLRNGSVITGDLELQDRHYLHVRTRYGKLRIHRTNVQRIEYR